MQLQLHCWPGHCCQWQYMCEIEGKQNISLIDFFSKVNIWARRKLILTVDTILALIIPLDSFLPFFFSYENFCPIQIGAEKGIHEILSSAFLYLFKVRTHVSKVRPTREHMLQKLFWRLSFQIKLYLERCANRKLEIPYFFTDPVLKVSST